MTFDEIVRTYQEGRARQEAAMRRIRADLEELFAANESVHSSIGLLEAFLGNLQIDNLLEHYGGENMPRFMKSLFTMDFDRLF